MARNGIPPALAYDQVRSNKHLILTEPDIDTQETTRRGDHESGESEIMGEDEPGRGGHSGGIVSRIHSSAENHVFPLSLKEPLVITSSKVRLLVAILCDIVRPMLIAKFWYTGLLLTMCTCAVFGIS